MNRRWSAFLVCIASLSAAAFFGFVLRHYIEFALGRFFRDVARSKARKRLYGNQYALVSMILGNDDPVPPSDTDACVDTVTWDELENADGQDGRPAYIAIRGRVYDVTAGKAFYGPGKPYHNFVGRDATSAFALGCSAPRCISASTEDLSPNQLKEVDRWIELYETHDRYTFVGVLVDDPVDNFVFER